MRIQEFKLDTGQWQGKTSKERSGSNSENGFDMIFQTAQTERMSTPAEGSYETENHRLQTETVNRRSRRTNESETDPKKDRLEAEDASSESVETVEQSESLETGEEIAVPEEREATEESPELETPEESQSEETIILDEIPISMEVIVQNTPEALPIGDVIVLDEMIPMEEAENPLKGTEFSFQTPVEEMESSIEPKPTVSAEYSEELPSLDPDMEAEKADFSENPKRTLPFNGVEKQILSKRPPVVLEDSSTKPQVLTTTVETIHSQPIQESVVLQNDSEIRQKEPKQAEPVIVLEESGADAGNQLPDMPQDDEIQVESAVRVKPKSEEAAGNQQVNPSLGEETHKQARANKELTNSTPSSNVPLESAFSVKAVSETLPASQTETQQPKSLSDLAGSHALHAEKQITVEARKATETSNTFLADETQQQANLDRVVKAAQAAVRGGSSRVQLRLDPPEMGLLRVEIRQSASGLQLQMQATSTEAHQMLQKSSHELRAALEMQGLGAAKVEIQLRLDLRNESSEQGSSNGQSYPQSQQQDGQPQSFQSPFSQDFGSEYGQGGYDSGLESTDAESGETVLSGIEPGTYRGDGWQETQFHRLDVQV